MPIWNIRKKREIVLKKQKNRNLKFRLKRKKCEKSQIP